MQLPARPTILEINTAVWLQRLAAKSGGSADGPLRLDQVPTSVWDAIAAQPVDAIWLMGVWQRSPAGLVTAAENDGWLAEMRGALPDLRTEDIMGSPFCVRDYVVDERLGGPEALATARAQLAERGIALILDYVPNHVAPDHSWLTDRPEMLLRGTPGESEAQRDAFLPTPGGIFALARDPFFPPWPDVVQANAFSTDFRDESAATLRRIAEQCDGVRCDMAMLMRNAVFERTWGERAGTAPEEEFWPPVIAAVKAERPGFTFIAESYWDMEPDLLRLGFDYCYDKKLYDHLTGEPEIAAAQIRQRLRAGSLDGVVAPGAGSSADHLLYFLENHDEPRAAQALGTGERGRAAAVVLATLPGAHMYYDGQHVGAKVRPPVFLGRAPVELLDRDLQQFYLRLLPAVASSGLRDATWSLCETSGWPDNNSHERLLAWTWDGPAGQYLVVVNLSTNRAQARVHFSFADSAAGSAAEVVGAPAGELAGDGSLAWDGSPARDDARVSADSAWDFTDQLTGQHFARPAAEVSRDGLYVDLPPWGFHFWRA